VVAEAVTELLAVEGAADAGAAVAVRGAVIGATGDVLGAVTTGADAAGVAAGAAGAGSVEVNFGTTIGGGGSAGADAVGDDTTGDFAEAAEDVAFVAKRFVSLGRFTR
jgi:hypothetical protein